MTKANEPIDEDVAVRELITRWCNAVRNENLAGIRADHDPEVLMFDVPPPFLSRGLEAYMATWRPFFAMQARPIEFALHDLEVTAGREVAFATAVGSCGDLSSGRKVDLRFRLTMGFRKHGDRWRIVHEHHSIPATDAGV